jgi:DNA-binding CsgD family transcriptional regulator
MTATHLRPIERRVLAMRADGLTDADIAGKIRKSPDLVSKMAEWAQLPGRDASRVVDDHLLTPLERRVVAMRDEGQSHGEIAERFRRSARFIRQVEGLARYRQYRELLG